MTVRVRIAPSPTGTPHVGTAYIALFNYCFARSQGGEFVLRVEDTDQARSEPRFEAMIMEALAWLGITWDEGPDVGGEHGPYRQSERTAIYQQYAQKLLDQGHAYKCFCTPERLEQARKSQFEKGASTGYDGHCGGLTPEQTEALEAAGTPFTVRMRVPQAGQMTVKEPLRGDIAFDYRVIDHQILLKSDGFPTYHLANVVDDHLMGITHVIRGEEWLSSLPKHLLLYQYLGWDPPEVYHLPLLRNPDKSKLSKRKNPTSILLYRDMGILPEALLNFLGLMAYSREDGREVFSLDEMIETFDVGRISLGGPVFDQEKLLWINQKHIQDLDNDQLLKSLKHWRFHDAFLGRLMAFMRPRMQTLGDFIKHCDFMFQTDLVPVVEQVPPKGRNSEESRDVLYKLLWTLEKVDPFESALIHQAFQDIAQMEDWSLRDVTHVARMAIAGKAVAPPLFEVMEILGPDMARHRLQNLIDLIGPLGKKKLDKLQKAYQATLSS